LHKELIADFNSRLGQNQDGAGYYLADNWTILAQNIAGQEQYNVEGYLAFPQLVASAESATLDESSNARRSRRDASVASNRTGEMSMGLAPWTTRRANARQREVVERKKVNRRDDASALFNVIYGGGRVREAVSPRGPKLVTGVARVVLEAYADAWDQFTQPIPRDKDTPVTILDLTERILQRLNTETVRFTERDVDTWVRMWTASPRQRDPESEAQEGNVGHDWWLEALSAIDKNLVKGMPPTYNSKLPILDYRQADLFRRSIAAGKFRARESEEGPLLDATDPQAAYRWAIGQANQSPTLDRAFLPAIDGAIHTYRAAGGALGGVPLSVDTLRAMQLVDPATDQLYLSSDRAMEDRLNDPRIAARELEFG